MQKNEKLLEALSDIDKRHIPDPKEIFNADPTVQEAEVSYSGDYKRKRFSIKAIAVAASLTAAAAALGISLKNYTFKEPITPPDVTDMTDTTETTSANADIDTDTGVDASNCGPYFPSEGPLSPLNDIYCYIDDDGKYRVDTEQWEASEDYGLFRQYFFGTWENGEAAFGERLPLFVIDDSESSFLAGNTNWRFNGFYRLYDDNVLAFIINGSNEKKIFWLNTEKPDIMYTSSVNSGVVTQNRYSGETAPGVLNKTDMPINEPENGYLSIYKLHEMSVEYGIKFDKLVDIEYELGNTEENPGLYIFHDDWHQFYPIYLVSCSEDRIELKTRLGNESEKNAGAEAEYTFQKIIGKWKRTVNLKLPSGAADVIEDHVSRELPEKDALKALDLLNCYKDEDGYWADGSDWTELTDYDLFREYFFGKWEFEYIPELGDSEPLIIDDSEKSYIAKYADYWYSGMFYRINGHVLAFVEGGTAGASIYWLDVDAPDTLYVTFGGSRKYGTDLVYIFCDIYVDKHIYVTALKKTSAEPNEPENGFLSMYRLYELSDKYGIEVEKLADIDYPEAISLVHDHGPNFYPMYLVSEAEDKIMLKTILWCYYYDDKSNAIEAVNTLEKINGKWIRTVILTLPSGETVPLADSAALDPSAEHVFNRLIWETKTQKDAKLPKLSVKPFCYYSTRAECFSEKYRSNTNPWKEDLIFDTLPVFRDKLYGLDESVQAGCTEKKELMRMAETAAELLGLTVNAEDTVVYVTYTNVVKEREYTEDMGKYPMSVKVYCDGAKYGTELVAITVYSDGTVYIIFGKAELIDSVADGGKPDECFKLPDGIYDGDDEPTEENIFQSAKALNYLISEFGELLQFEQPYMDIYKGSGYSGQWFSLSLRDTGRDSYTDRILNYNFSSARFWFNLYDRTELRSITLKNSLALRGEYAGDYPVISAEDAKEILLSGKYSEQYLIGEYKGKRLEHQNIPIEETANEKIDESQIRSVSLVYEGMNYHDQEFFQPYYVFHVESEPYYDETEGEDMIVSADYYVPAVREDYISGVDTSPKVNN